MDKEYKLIILPVSTRECRNHELRFNYFRYKITIYHKYGEILFEKKPKRYEGPNIIELNYHLSDLRVDLILYEPGNWHYITNIKTNKSEDDIRYKHYMILDITISPSVNSDYKAEMEFYNPDFHPQRNGKPVILKFKPPEEIIGDKSKLPPKWFPEYKIILNIFDREIEIYSKESGKNMEFDYLMTRTIVKYSYVTFIPLNFKIKGNGKMAILKDREFKLNDDQNSYTFTFLLKYKEMQGVMPVIKIKEPIIMTNLKDNPNFKKCQMKKKD